MNDTNHDIPACLNYAFQDGVGGDGKCQLQVVADKLVTSAADESEQMVDALKVNLFKSGSVFKALQMCKAAKAAKWALIVGCEEQCCETSDTFIADFAVGVGAGQFSGGGLDTGECMAKYNRILEISKEDEGIAFAGRNFRSV